MIQIVLSAKMQVRHVLAARLDIFYKQPIIYVFPHVYQAISQIHWVRLAHFAPSHVLPVLELHFHVFPACKTTIFTSANV